MGWCPCLGRYLTCLLGACVKRWAPSTEPRENTLTRASKFNHYTELDTFFISLHSSASTEHVLFSSPSAGNQDIQGGETRQKTGGKLVSHPCSVLCYLIEASRYPMYSDALLGALELSPVRCSHAFQSKHEVAFELLKNAALITPAFSQAVNHAVPPTLLLPAHHHHFRFLMPASQSSVYPLQSISSRIVGFSV
jgi:hypothetical protein